jgi:DNA-binding winged helix-turn-helix (wHTH) protein
MPVYRFGEFALDTRSGELRRGAYRVRLRPQPASVLEYLLEHPGEVVTRMDLRQVLWPEGTYVHFDHGLNSCMKQLRAALLDDRVAPRFLETLPRRGYRFIGPVVTEHAPGAGNDVQRSVTGAQAGGQFTVSGSGRLEGARLRVSVQLTDASTNTQVWSADFDCDAGDVRGTQARIVAEIIEGMVETLRGEPSRTVETTGQADAVMM